MKKNKNRPEYKKTKVGWIPEDWKCVRLGEVFKKSNARGKEGVPVFSISQEYGLVRRDSLDRRVETTLSSEDCLLVEPGDIAYNMMRMWQGAVDVCCETCVVSPAYVVCHPLVDRVSSEFMLLYFKLPIGLYKLWSYSYGVVDDRLRLYYNDFRLVPAPLPSIPEQEAIAGVLECWDKAIRNYNKKIEKKRNIKKGLMQRLLVGKQRLPGFEGKWKKVRLGEVLYEHGQKSTGREEVYSVSVRKGLINQVEHLGRSFAAADTSNYNLVKPGDIVYTKSPTGDFPYGIIKQSRLSKDVIVSPLYGVFTPITVHLGLMLDCYFESPVNMGNYLRPIIQKGAKNTINITNTTFLSNHLFLPVTPEEQKANASVFTCMEREIQALEHKLATLRDQKRFLLNNMVTGTIRLPKFARAKHHRR